MEKAQTDLGGVELSLDDSLGLWDYLTAGIIFVAAIILGRVARIVVKRLVEHGQADSFLGDLFGRMVNYLVVALGLIYALESLGIAIAPLLGALGIAGIALAFALQNILENFVAGVILQLRRPFTAGDEIESGDHYGTVTAVDARTVTILTPDGETVRLPSAEVIRSAIVNHTQHGGRRTTLDVGVAYGTDLALATRLAVEAAASVDGVRDQPAPHALVHTFGDSSIDLAVRFWHDPTIAAHWRTRDGVAQAVVELFATNDVEIPFPQRVLHHASEPEA